MLELCHKKEKMRGSLTPNTSQCLKCIYPTQLFPQALCRKKTRKGVLSLLVVIINNIVIITVVIVITFYSPSCLGQETAKGLFGLRVKLPPAHLSTTHDEASHCPFNCWTSSREAVNTNFYSLWFDSTGNRTRVYRFSSRRSIHSTTDRFVRVNAKRNCNWRKCGLRCLYFHNWLYLNWGVGAGRVFGYV